MNLDFNNSTLAKPASLCPLGDSKIGNYMNDGGTSLLADSIALIAHQYGAIYQNGPASLSPIVTSTDPSSPTSSGDHSLSTPFTYDSSPATVSPCSTTAAVSSSPTSSATACSSRAEDLTCVRINGRKMFGPPINWSGPPPPIAAEVFVKRIPRNMNEQHLYALFRRFGPIYCIRLMVDFNEDNRGFGYVHYTSVAAADRALYVLQHLYIQPRVQLYLERSFDKCRLFVSHLPRDLSVKHVRAGICDAFDEVSTVNVFPANGCSGNRGYAFVDFPTHDAAIRAKQLASTGRMRLFDHDVRIVWAHPVQSIAAKNMCDLHTLTVRNVVEELRQADLLAIIVQFVKKSDVRKVSRKNDQVIVELCTRAAAKRVMNGLQGYMGLKRASDVKWSIPPVNSTPPPDHDATLRLMCVANEWLVPIYLFGRIYTENMSQYVCVILSAPESCSSGNVRQQRCALFMEVRLSGADLQSRAAEVAVSLVRRSGRLPSVNHVLVVEQDAYLTVGCIADLQTGAFKRAACSPGPLEHSVALHWAELETLAKCAHHLLLVSRSQLQQRYAEALCMTLIGPYGYLPDLRVSGRIFGAINPGYRRQPPLEHGCDMGQLVLVACDSLTGRNYNLGDHASNTVHVLPLETAGGVTDLLLERMELTGVVQSMPDGTGDNEPELGENFVVFFGPAPPAAAVVKVNQ